MANKNFYLLDKCCGNVVTIDGKSAYDLFNADLAEVKHVPGVVTAEFQRALGASGISLMDHTIAVGGLELTFYVGGATNQECYLHTSNLVAASRSCVLSIEDDEFEYVAVLTNFAVDQTKLLWYNKVTLTWSVVKRLPLVTVTGASEVHFINVGSFTSGMRITITPSQAITVLKVNGTLTCTNLMANVPFVIDGIDGSITANGVNRFLDTNLIEFPTAVPGMNTLTVDSQHCALKVEYYPTLIV